MEQDSESGWQPRQQCNKATNKEMTVAAAIDDLGMGWAQLLVVALSAAAVSFCDGVELNLMNVVATSTSSEFGLSANERAALSMVTLAGFMIGSLFSGYSDSMGRRKPTVFSLGFTALFGCISAVAPSYMWLLLCRLALGVGMGFGLPPSIALASEVTPEVWRIPVKTLSSAAFAFGSVFIALLSAFDDASFQALHWRRLMVMAAIPPAIWCVVSWLLLDESPVFLASVGRSEEALAVFTQLRQLNDRPHTPINLRNSMNSASAKDLPSVWSGINVLLSRQYFFTTVALFLASFSTNLVSYGDSYAAPQVLPATSEMAPAWMLVIKSVVQISACLAAGFVSQVLPRKWTIVVSLILLSLVAISFAVGGQILGPRSPLQAALFQCGAHGSAVGTSLSYVVLFQAAVEIYPTFAATTGGAAIIGGGRIAAVIAPMVFEDMRETFGTWVSFYYLLAATCALTAAIVVFIPSLRPYRLGEAGLSEDPESCGPGYGTLAAAK